MQQTKRPLLPSLLNVWMAAALLSAAIWRANVADPPGASFAIGLLVCLLAAVLLPLAGQMARVAAYRSAGWGTRAAAFGGFCLLHKKGRRALRACGMDAGRGVLLLSMVVPETPDIAAESDFERARTVLARANMSQVYGTNLTALLLFGLGFGLSFLLPAEWIPYLLVCAFTAVIIAAALNWAALRHTQLMIGPWAAARLCAQDDFFAAYCLYALLPLQENGTARREKNVLLRNALAQALGEIPPQRAGRFALEAFDLLLMEQMADPGLPPIPAVEQYLEHFTQDYQALRRGRGAEIYPELFLHVLYALKLRGDDRWRIMKVHVGTVQKLLPGNKVRAYYRLQTLQIIYNEDHRETLARRENICSCAAWKLLSLFENACDDELALNRARP